MGQLTRYDWAKTTIGSPEEWPQSLRTTLSLMLHTRSPMFLWWGTQLIQFYNDAYRPSLGRSGKHPTALGQPDNECWTEIWPTIEPLINQVLTEGEATWSENQLLPIERNGQLEDVYWTFGYSPVYGEEGQVAGVLVICQETTQQVIALRQLTVSEERFQQLIEQAPVAVALFSGPHFVITLANERVLEYWGRNRDQVMNRPLFEALPEARGQGFEELLQQVYSSGERFVAKELSVTLQRQGQLQNTYIDFVYEPFYELDRTIIGVMVVCTEITEQVLARQVIEESEAAYRSLAKELEGRVQVRTQELQQANQDLSRSNESLQQFAYVASHDLQEPLRKIQSFSNLLEQQYSAQLGEAGHDLLQRIGSAGSRMSTLIRDLLSYSRLAARQEPFAQVSLDAVIANVLYTLDWEIAQRTAQLAIAQLPVVTGDESQLTQLFQNLVSNALKFTPTGQTPHIHVTYDRREAHELPAEVNPTSTAAVFHQISVQDQGIGFDIKYLDRVFQVFQRLHGRNEFPGTGVGLAICQRVVENHGGSITADSAPGQGATFCVYLPT